MTHERLPILRAEELVRILERLGFQCTRKSPGSHRRFIHPDGRRTSVPVHRGRTLGRGLLRKILADVELTADEFRKLLR